MIRDRYHEHCISFHISSLRDKFVKYLQVLGGNPAKKISDRYTLYEKVLGKKHGKFLAINYSGGGRASRTTCLQQKLLCRAFRRVPQSIGY